MSETRFMLDETRSISTPRVKAFRRRARHGLRRMAVLVTSAQIDALEEKGYLDPDLRGERVDRTSSTSPFKITFSAGQELDVTRSGAFSTASVTLSVTANFSRTFSTFSGPMNTPRSDWRGISG
jgi:hypothetical protein